LYHEKYLELLSAKRNELTEKYNSHVRKFLGKFGLAQKEMVKWHNRTLLMITHHRLEGLDPHCLYISEKYLIETSEDAGRHLQDLVWEVGQELKYLFDSHIIDYLDELEKKIWKMHIEMLLSFERNNPGSELDQIIASLASGIYFYGNYYYNAKERLDTDISDFEESVSQYLELIFMRIDSELSFYVRNVKEIQWFIGTCQ
jgi:hypothetical protein